MNQVAAKKTPLSRADAIRGLVWALSMRLGELAPDGAILLCGAQWCLETGSGASMYNYNAAGLKGRAGPEAMTDWTYYPTRERLKTSVAKVWLADPRVTEVSREITPEGGDYTTVRVAPEHPACCFRAYGNAEEGFIDYVDLLARRFAKAWAALFDPATTPQHFANVLRAQGYYTAPAATYGVALTQLTVALRPVVAAYHADVAAPADVPETLDERALYARVRALLATTVLYGPSRETVAWGDAA